MVQDKASVHSPNYSRESMLSRKEKDLQHRLNQWDIGAMHRLNRWVLSQQRSMSEGPNDNFRLWVIGWTDTPILRRRFNRCFDRFCYSLGQRLYGLDGLYIHLTLAIWSLLEFRETLYTLKNTSKPTKGKVMITLVLSTPLWVLVLG
jgi:hypothetical protein